MTFQNWINKSTLCNILPRGSNMLEPRAAYIVLVGPLTGDMGSATDVPRRVLAIDQRCVGDPIATQYCVSLCNNTLWHLELGDEGGTMRCKVLFLNWSILTQLYYAIVEYRRLSLSSLLWRPTQRYSRGRGGGRCAKKWGTIIPVYNWHTHSKRSKKHKKTPKFRM